VPHKDLDWRKFSTRMSLRNMRHPNWRQAYIDCDGVCQFPDEETGVCGSIGHLEFHEPFGEVKKGRDSHPKFQQRILLCRIHHGQVHNRELFKRRYYSRLVEDVQIEIARDGGLQNWMKKHGLHAKGDNGAGAIIVAEEVMTYGTVSE